MGLYSASKEAKIDGSMGREEVSAYYSRYLISTAGNGAASRSTAAGAGDLGSAAAGAGNSGGAGSIVAGAGDRGSVAASAGNSEGVERIGGRRGSDSG